MLAIRRLYHLSAPVNSAKKQGIKLCKLIEPKTKKRWYPSQSMETGTLPSLKSLTKIERQPGKQGIRRVAMLNKLFMKQISDIMSTGTVAMDVVGRGIEISKVNVSPNMQTVSVFWVCKGTSKDEETEAVLNSIAGALRHELSTLRVMGEVPYIAFVKDKHESHVAELDRRLAEADFGEDYAPTDPGHIIKSEFTLNTKLSPEMKAKIRQLEEEVPIIEEPIPEMTHNIYGLDHAKIMNRLLAARKKTADAWISLEQPVISYRTPERTTQEPDVKDQRRQLAEFLQKRQIMQNKLHKQLRDTRSVLASDEPVSEYDEDIPYLDDEEEEYEDDEDFEDTIRFEPDTGLDGPSRRTTV